MKVEVIDKLAWIEIYNGRILSTRSRGRAKYYIPGGKREEGETDFEALSREIKEELTVNLIENTLEFIEIFQAQADGHPKGVHVKMTCYSAKFNGTVIASSEIEEVVWLSYKDRNIVSPVDQVIFDWLKERSLIL